MVSIRSPEEINKSYKKLRLNSIFISLVAKPIWHIWESIHFSLMSPQILFKIRNFFKNEQRNHLRHFNLIQMLGWKEKKERSEKTKVLLWTAGQISLIKVTRARYTWPRISCAHSHPFTPILYSNERIDISNATSLSSFLILTLFLHRHKINHVFWTRIPRIETRELILILRFFIERRATFLPVTVN